MKHATFNSVLRASGRYTGYAIVVLMLPTVAHAGVDEEPAILVSGGDGDEWAVSVWIPKVFPPKSTWKLFVGSLSSERESGTLGSQATLLINVVSVSASQIAHLVIYDENGAPLALKSKGVGPQRPTLLQRHAGVLLGALVGFLASLLIIPAQEWFKSLRERAAMRVSLRTSVCVAATELLSAWDDAEPNARYPRLPDILVGGAFASAMVGVKGKARDKFAADVIRLRGIHWNWLAKSAMPADKSDLNDIRERFCQEG